MTAWHLSVTASTWSKIQRPQRLISYGMFSFYKRLQSSVDFNFLRGPRLGEFIKRRLSKISSKFVCYGLVPSFHCQVIRCFTFVILLLGVGSTPVTNTSNQLCYINMTIHAVWCNHFA